MTNSVVHGTFTIERTYDVPPVRVFAGFSNPQAKRRWLVEGEGFTVDFYEPAFDVGHFERSGFRYLGGPPMTNDTVYLEIVPQERIIFAYTMTVGGAYISSSHVTVELRPNGDGTHLRLTEQGAYLDGHDDIAGREEGSRQLLDALAREVEAG